MARPLGLPRHGCDTEEVPERRERVTDVIRDVREVMERTRATRRDVELDQIDDNSLVEMTCTSGSKDDDDGDNDRLSAERQR